MESREGEEDYEVCLDKLEFFGMSRIHRCIDEYLLEGEATNSLG